MSRCSIVVIGITIALMGCAQIGWADPTPPIMPASVETPLPTPVTLPAPENVPAGVADRPLTAAEAALIALQRQPSITVARMGAQAATGRVQQADSALHPSLAVSGGYNNQMISPSGSNTTDDFTTGATVRQLVFDYHHTRDLARQAAAQAQSAHANLTRAQSDLVLQVKQDYYTYVQDSRLISVNEANVRNQQEHLAQAQARVNVGIGLPVDVVRAETAVANAIQNLVVARNTAAVARVKLALAMGLDPRTPLDVAEDSEPVQQTADFTALLTTALRQRPEIAQAQANILASQLGVNVAKTSNAPALVSTLGLGLRSDHFPPTDTSLALGFAVQWNAYDAGLKAGKVTEAQANLQSTQAQLLAETQAVTSDVSQAYLNELTAAQRIVTADAEVTNAEEAVRLAQGRYTAGLGTFLDVLDAQAALVTAQTNRINAQSASNLARADLAHAMNSDPVLQTYLAPTEQAGGGR